MLLCFVYLNICFFIYRVIKHLLVSVTETLLLSLFWLINVWFCSYLARVRQQKLVSCNRCLFGVCERLVCFTRAHTHTHRPARPVARGHVFRGGAWGAPRIRQHSRARSSSGFHTEIAGGFHWPLQRNDKKHVELNVILWSKQYIVVLKVG